MSQDEAMLNSEKLEPVALAITELLLSKGINHSVSQLVGRSVSQ